GGPEPRITQRERLLARIEIELPPKVLVSDERSLEAAERRVDGLRRIVDCRVLPVADQVRPERDTQGAVAEHQPALPLTFGERRRASLSEPGILQELVIRDQRVARGLRATPC